MKSILVFSDSHGKTLDMHEIIQSKPWDMIFHLGDSYEDMLELKEVYEIPIYGVPGNVDFVKAQGEITLRIMGHKILICHGHQYQVKQGKTKLRSYGLKEGYDLLLFGHTHEAYVEKEPILLMNPGSIRLPRNGEKKSYGVLEISETGISTEIVYIT